MVKLCEICGDSYEGEHLPTIVAQKTSHEHFRKRTCEHMFGRSCLRRWIESKLDDHSCVIR